MRLFSGLGSQPDGTHGRRAGAAARWGRHLAAGWGVGGDSSGLFLALFQSGERCICSLLRSFGRRDFWMPLFPTALSPEQRKGRLEERNPKSDLKYQFSGRLFPLFPSFPPPSPPPRPLCGTWVLRAPSSGSAAWARGAKGLAPPVPLFAPLFSGGSGGRSHAPPGCPSREGCDPPCPSPEGDRSSCAPKTCPVPAGLTRVLGLWPGAGCRMLGASYEAPPAPSRAPLGHPWVKDRR